MVRQFLMLKKMRKKLLRKIKHKSLMIMDNLKWFLGNFYRTDMRRLDQRIVPPYSNSHGFKINYFSDGLVVLNNCDCLGEPRFKKAYEKSLEIDDWRGLDGSKMDMRWRYYIVCWMADYIKHLEGDFVECGVYKGGYSLAVMHYVNFNQLNKVFYLLDTFEGLDPKYASKEEIESGLLNTYAHYLPVYESVKKTFNSYNVKIIKGTVPETLPQCSPDKICYLSIDMNMKEPEIAAANYFWDRLVPGAVMILDDYGFAAHIEQKLAFDEFAREKGVNILSLPTGQAIIFKQ